ncbi:AMSH-like protease sst2 [Fusarium napiforme]|uniref:AMSH-like protease sst2 n=1 Tax=Fusarium napiforme TaxID=42672 RepID=A0A8H5MQW3_9HYPO|nr:AMSH-like protease sst2 [Fusarium napiforme]
MDSRIAMRPTRPQTVKELVAQAENFKFNTNIPVKHWTRAAETLYQEASFAVSDGDFGRAYMMLYRHSVLVLKYIPTHPQFKDPDNKKVYKVLSRRIPRVIQDLEQLKPEIENAVKEWERMALSNTEPEPSSRYEQFAARDPSLTGNAKILDAFDNQDLAVDLAQKELMRRDTARRATRQAGITDEDIMSRRRGGRWDQWDGARVGDDEDLRRQMEATRHALDSAQERRTDDDYRPTSHTYSYPSISRSRAVDYEGQTPIPSIQPSRPPKEPVAPPPKEPLHTPSLQSLPPALPQKVPLPGYAPLIPSPSPQPARPEVPRKEALDTPPTLPKKERLTFKPGAYLENGDPIRSLFLPKNLRQKFLDIAADNTRRGLEMCGMLCGTPINNALFVRCLLIPDQKCTSDTCETENEEVMFDYCMKEDLLLLGWIHTHPTQTCFMSSRDLHTHAGYQVMMPESVAIVCAPKFQPS